MPPKRMTANPLAPQRYRAGKPLPANDSPSASESESESDSDAPAAPKPSRVAPPKASSFPKLGSDLSARQKAAAEARVKELAAQRQGNVDEEGFVTASDSSAEDEDDDGSEESDSEADYESSSDDDRPRFVAPTFVSKAKRITNGHGASEDSRAREERERLAYEAEEKRRKEKADEILQAQIEQDAREKAESRRDWDDEVGAELDDIDDRDGIDPEAEHAAWRLRELMRLKRDREAIEAVEQEKEEIERRRNLSKEEREEEDRQHIEAQQEEREGRGKMGFMQKYFHKGAFFQGDVGDEEIQEVMSRDVMGARFVDEARDREILPQYMQIRDMTKLGKKGRTRYRDLKSEDTGRFGDDLRERRGKGDAGGRYDGPSGANNVAVGERRRRDDQMDGRDEKRPRYEQ